ncbi:MAG: T9SS type A sorting domain-containing protein [Bacteroidales bacterium]|nr:T9SS type A sorting domain-containing protein [Bacteroidales bacterium]MDD4217410.1 T9SS type A sorting domain-containing protein [Bacteroidales bacterium]
MNENDNITISACNEIVINGDVEFIADGENELILEINNSPCLQNGNKSLSDIHKTTGEDRIEKGSIYSCFPNPVIDILNVSVFIEQKQDLNFRIINTQGQMILHRSEKNIEAGIYIFQFDVKSFPPGMYFINLNIIEKNNLKFIKN